MLPAAQLKTSPAPLSDFLNRYWGGNTGTVLAIFATISSLGALIGWVFLQGEVAWIMAERGVFPAWLAKTTANGTPVRAHLVSSAALTFIVMANFKQIDGRSVHFRYFVVHHGLSFCLFVYCIGRTETAISPRA